MSDIQNKWIISSPENPEYFPKFQTIGQTIWNKMKKMGDAIAQIDGDTGKSDTYEELLSRSVRVALGLQARGIASEDFISICSNNHGDTWTPILAAYFLNIIVAPIDPNLPLNAAEDALNLIKPRIIFCTQDSEIFIETLINTTKIDCEIIVFGNTEKHTSFRELLKENIEEKNFEPKSTDMMSTATVYFSSGTTGKSKAVCLNHFSLIYQLQSFAKNRNFRVTLFYSTPYWITNAVFKICTILTGGINVYSQNFEPNTALNIIAKYKVTFMMISTTVMYVLNSCMDRQTQDTSSIKSVVIGGAQISEKQLEIFRSYLPNAFVNIVYGSTEVISTCLSFDEFEDRDLYKSKPMSCGRVNPGFTMKVVCTKTGKILGPNNKGELHIKAKCLMNGYYNDPQRTEESYDIDGYFKTGDIVYYDDDLCFYIVDRLKDVFKYKENTIIPAKLENILLAHPNVSEAVVMGVPYDFDNELPTAVVVLKNESNCSEEDILEYINGRVPSKYELKGGIKIVNSILKTPSHKYSRYRIRQLVIDGKI